MAYTVNYDSNLILLGQLHKSGIMYIDNANAMILMYLGQLIAYMQKNQNLFILDLTTPNRAM